MIDPVWLQGSDVPSRVLGRRHVLPVALRRGRDVLALNVKDYGAKGDGVTDDTESFNEALADACADGTEVYVPAGTYLVGELTCECDGLVLRGAGREATTLKAAVGSIYIIRWALSYGYLADMTLDGDGLAGTHGLAVNPLDETTSGPRVDQNWNVFERLRVYNCTEGISMRAGPQVGGADSGCWYNAFNDVQIQDCVRGLWLRSPIANAGQGSPCNRNRFISVRIGNTGLSRANTGVQIDAADSCMFVGLATEGIQSGTNPNNPPVAVYVQESDSVSGFDNNGNFFFAFTSEACTRDVVVDNTRTCFVASNIVQSKVSGSALPNGAAAVSVGYAQFIGQQTAADQPLILPGAVYPESTGYSGFTSGVWSFLVPVQLMPQVAGGSYPAKALLVGPVGSDGAIGTRLVEFAARNADWGEVLVLRADSVGRCLGLVTADFNVATNTGRKITVNPASGQGIQQFATGTAGTADLRLQPVGSGVDIATAGGVLKVNGTQVVKSREAAVTAPSGGATIDSQARTAINDIIARLQAHGLIS